MTKALTDVNMFGVWSAVVAATVALCFLVLWLTSPAYAYDEPQPIGHTLPVLGHALSFARDQKGLFQWAE